MPVGMRTELSHLLSQSVQVCIEVYRSQNREIDGLLRDPRMDALRDHPAFEELVAKWGRQ